VTHTQPDEIIVTVRRQWNDWREARYRLRDIEGLHWTDVSGGVNARAPRALIHGYVWCNGMIDGELAHSCQHGEGPHRVLVCVVKKANKSVWSSVLEALNEDAP
jgi:hypothetical protein